MEPVVDRAFRDANSTNATAQIDFVFKTLAICYWYLLHRARNACPFRGSKRGRARLCLFLCTGGHRFLVCMGQFRWGCAATMPQRRRDSLNLVQITLTPVISLQKSIVCIAHWTASHRTWAGLNSSNQILKQALLVWCQFIICSMRSMWEWRRCDVVGMLNR